MNTDLPSVADIIADMRGLMASVDDAFGEVMALARTLPEHEKAYELVYNTTLIRSTATSADRRKAEAGLAAADEKEQHTATEHMLRAQRQFVSVLQTEISALQSISNALRAELDLAGKGPR